MSTNTFPALFTSKFLGITQAEVYGVPSTPSGTLLQDLQLKVTNVTTATRAITLWSIPNGGSASNETAIVVDFTVPPKDYFLIPVERIAAGGTIEGLADQSNSVTIQAIGGKLHVP